MKPIERTWFDVDGTLTPIEYDGPSYFRFPSELAERVIATWSKIDDWVLDPFCGFGTTLTAAQRLGRHAVGFEKETDRAAFVARGIFHPNRVIADVAERIGAYDLPEFDLLLTSPPYTSFRNPTGVEDPHYLNDLRTIFGKLRENLRHDATIVVEISNVRDTTGVRTVAWEAAMVLSNIFTFQGEVVRCNTSRQEAGPGYDHSYLLVFRNS